MSILIEVGALVLLTFNTVNASELEEVVVNNENGIIIIDKKVNVEDRVFIRELIEDNGFNSYEEQHETN